MITGNEPVNAIVPPQGSDGLPLFEGSIGETLRQKWASRIMAGLNMNNYTQMSQEELAKIAVRGADALVNELNKTETNQ